jgi:membrane-bound lytic murein transglycosylase MltF
VSDGDYTGRIAPCQPPRGKGVQVRAEVSTCGAVAVSPADVTLGPRHREATREPATMRPVWTLFSPALPSSRTLLAVLAVFVLTSASSACGGTSPESAAESPAEGAQTATMAGAALEDVPEGLPAHEAALPEAVRNVLYTPFTGDLDQMITRRLIRVGVTFNRTFYFADQGVQRGVAYEMGKAFEDQLNAKHKTGNTRINVVFMPMPRDALGAALIDGKVDLVIAQVTVRPELQARVDFTNATRTNVSEVVVTGPGVPAIASVDDLSGRDVYTRRDSVFHASLLALNDQLKAKGRPPVVIREVPGNLEDDDLLEMVNAGLLPMVVVHDYMAAFWSKVFTNLTVHDTVTLRTGASFAVPVRKGSPLLVAELNAFLATHGLGTAFGNVIEKRYLVSTTFAKNANAEAERAKFLQMVRIFEKYSAQYEMDYLLMAAQGYQESQLNQGAKSRVGAIGVMQVMPATGRDMNVGDITLVDANIHAGVKYMRWMVDQYYKDEPIEPLNKWLFTFASYNAGPGRMRQLRREAGRRGLDPDVWFGNVEQIASEKIGRETVTYVSNIYKYYVAYRLIEEDRARREASRQAVTAGAR